MSEAPEVALTPEAVLISETAPDELASLST